jgi:hypothetical protein
MSVNSHVEHGRKWPGPDCRLCGKLVGKAAAGQTVAPPDRRYRRLPPRPNRSRPIVAFPKFISRRLGALAARRAGTCQNFTNRKLKRSVSLLIDGSNTLIKWGSSWFASMVLSASSKKQAAATASPSEVGSI